MPSSMAWRKAARVFSGASSEPPRWAMRMGSSISAKVLHRPAFPRCNLLHPGLRVDHHGVAEETQYFVVGVVVGIGIRPGEVETVFFREVPDQDGLITAVWIITNDFAGQLAVYHFDVRGDQVSSTDVFLQRFQ